MRLPGTTAPPISRRTFIGWGVGGAALALTAGSGPAFAAADDVATMQVFMLDPDWGYPRGPHGKTRLISAASRRAAANRVALTAADAEVMNLHLCSYAPPRPMTVRRAELTELWDTWAVLWHSDWADADVTIVDLRHVLADPRSAERWATAISTFGGPPPELPASSEPSGASRPSAAGVGDQVTTTSTHQAGGATLADTGTDIGLGKVGAGLLAAGISLAALGARRREVNGGRSDAAPFEPN